MSLINQVLCDLQRRQATQPEIGLQQQMAPVSSLRVWPQVKYLLPLGILLLGISGWIFSPLPAKKVQPAIAVVPISVTPGVPATVVPKPLAGVHLSAVRLIKSAESSRLLLEFSQPPQLEPAVIAEERQLRVLFPELMTTAQSLPQPPQADDLVSSLKLVKIDELWQLLVGFKTDVRIEKVVIAADSLYGERLAFDISPYAVPAQNIPQDKVPVTAPSRIKEDKVPVEIRPAVTKQPSVQTVGQQAEGFYQRGLFAIKAGQRTDAVKLWLKTLQLQPDHLPARKQVILALVGSDQTRADRLFLEGLAYGKPLELRKWYARVLLPLVGPEKALSALANPQVSTREDQEYRALQAGLWQQQGNLIQAQQGYRELLLSSPENGLYHFGLAVSLDQQAHGEEALHEYRTAMAGVLESSLRNYANQRIQALASHYGGVTR